MEHTVLRIREEGARARKAGLGLDTNPYVRPGGTAADKVQEELWAAGWNQGMGGQPVFPAIIAEPEE
jgi:hypothetical protein